MKNFLDELIELNTRKPRIIIKINELEIHAQWMEINFNQTLLNLQDFHSPMGIIEQVQLNLEQVESISILD